MKFTEQHWTLFSAEDQCWGPGASPLTLMRRTPVPAVIAPGGHVTSPFRASAGRRGGRGRAGQGGAVRNRVEPEVDRSSNIPTLRGPLCLDQGDSDSSTNNNVPDRIFIALS